jgi:hypothetical protein
MRLLADENFPRAAVVALAAAGHDVVWVRTATPGAADAEVLAQAAREQRILLTFDKDFGELAGRSPATRACGIVLVRLPPPRSPESGQRFAALFDARGDWAGHFSVVEPGRIRMRSLGG